MFSRRRVDDPAAANRGHRRIRADNETVLAMRDQRAVEVNLRQYAFTRLHFVTIEQGDPGGHLRGPHVQVHRVAELERARGCIEQVDPRVEAFRHGKEARRGDNRAADQVTSFQTGQVEGDPLSGPGDLGFFTMDLDFTYPHGLSGGHDFYGITNLDPT